MPEHEPVSGPRRPDAVEREFFETLRQAAWIFEREQGGRFQGSIIACRAVARFIHQRGGGAELAGPFLQIAAAFAFLEKGGRPTLFAKKTVPAGERNRSPERKHVQRLAAAALEVLAELGDPVKKAADTIARHVNRWPGMTAPKLTGATVVAWRAQQRRSKSREFAALVRSTLDQADPRAIINGLLRSGPPGLFR